MISAACGSSSERGARNHNPILRQGQCAGCFLILNTQPNFFAAHGLTMLQRYCELMAIALRDDEWYAPMQLALHVMPSASTQQAYLASCRLWCLDYIHQKGGPTQCQQHHSRTNPARTPM
jgi:hypothetical protein